MNELRIAASDLRTMQTTLLSHDREQCAAMFVTYSRTGGGHRLLVRKVAFPTPADYLSSGLDHAVLAPTYVAAIAKEARLAKMGLVFVHTHPGSTPPQFSIVDDRGELDLADFLKRRGMGDLHAAMVLSKGGLRARLLGQERELRVVSVGSRLTVEFDPNLGDQGYPMEFDRQVRALGQAGQKTLQQLRVAIVGLGGTGSIIAEQLVHLGVRDFLLIDPDHLEVTNLNRVVGATHKDVGLPKVEIAKRLLMHFTPQALVTALTANVVYASAARPLADVDLIFGCTDSHGSRSVLQQVAYQYLIPCIDIGSTIVAKDGKIEGIYGRVQLLGPDHPCLWCTNLLSSEEVRRDLMNEFERKADPYVQGAHEPAPAVISLNGTVVSLAVTMLLGLVSPAPIEARHLIYNARTSSLRAVRGVAQPDCFICSRSGAFGRGDSQPLFARQD